MDGKVSCKAERGAQVAPWSVEITSLPNPSVEKPAKGDSIEATQPLLVWTILQTVWLKVPAEVG